MSPKTGQRQVGQIVGSGADVILVALEMPAGADGTGEHAIGGEVIEDNFAFWVPLNLAAENHRDVTEVGDGDGAMAYLDGGYRLGTSFDAIEKIAEVALAMVAGGSGQVDFVGADFFFQHTFGLGANAAAGNVDPASVADESDALTIMVVAADVHRQAVGISALEFVIKGGVPEAVLREQTCAMNFDGAGFVAIHTPVGDVDVMGSPVGNLAAGVIKEPSEIPMAAILCIWGPGSRAEPGFVVEAVGNGHRRLGVDVRDGWSATAGIKAEADTNFDSLEPADALIADEFAREAKVLRRALPASGLPNAAVTINGFYEVAALGDCQGEGLFAVNILACPQAHNGGD